MGPADLEESRWRAAAFFAAGATLASGAVAFSMRWLLSPSVGVVAVVLAAVSAGGVAAALAGPLRRARASRSLVRAAGLGVAVAAVTVALFAVAFGVLESPANPARAVRTARDVLEVALYTSPALAIIGAACGVLYAVTQRHLPSQP